MDKQSKFLDKNYLETRINGFEAIKKHELKYFIHESDRVMSKSLYIDFWAEDGDKNYKQSTIRISDHSIDCHYTQFIIEPYEEMTRKKKQQFVRLVESAIKKANGRSLRHKLEKL